MALCEAIRVYARYEIPNQDGETRRERNERAEVESPLLEIPKAGEYLFDWFDEISKSITRIREGLVYKIPPSEFKAWSELSGNDLRPFEFETLLAMDAEFTREIQLETSAIIEARNKKGGK